MPESAQQWYAQVHAAIKTDGSREHLQRAVFARPRPGAARLGELAGGEALPDGAG